MRAIIRTTTAVVAQGTIALALLAGCDGTDRAVATAPSTHERVHAEEHDRSAHLQGQASTHDTGRADPGRLAVAEELDRSARLDGQARTHSGAEPSDVAPAPAEATSVDDFVPGSRHMPMR